MKIPETTASAKHRTAHAGITAAHGAAHPRPWHCVPFSGRCLCLLLSTTLIQSVLSISAMAQPQQTAAVQDSAAVPTGSAQQDPAAGSAEAEKSATTPEELPAELPPAIAIPLQPYLVRVEVALARIGSMPTWRTAGLLQDISDSIYRVYGNMWQYDVAVSDWLLPGNELQLRNLTTEELHQRYGESAYQKVLLTTVEPRDGGFQISCREYDVRVQDLTPVVTAFTFDSRAIAAESARLMRDCFRPFAVLSGPSRGTDVLEFYLQAGALVPPDPSAAQIVEGDVMRPFLRHMERRDPSSLRLLQKLDLTYIRVTEFNQELTATGISSDDEDVVVENAVADPDAVYVDRGRLRGVLISHGAAPYGGRGRSVEQVALRQRPMAVSSEIQLVLKQREDRPLVCYRVDKVAKLRYRDESNVPSERLVSDREGRIRIAVDPQNPTFWLYVYSGSLLLARVPYAPGLLESDTIRLPDDSIRLGVEGELYLFRDQLVDVVARQAVFMGIARQAAGSGETQKLESAVSELAALPGRREFEAQLNAIRRPALDRAAELRNTSATRTVNRLCDAMARSLETFFTSDKQVKQMQEIQKLRNLAAQKAAVGN